MSEFRAIEHVPRWAVSLGVMGSLLAGLWAWLGRDLPGGAALLPLFLILGSLGVTLGLCGILLALRDHVSVWLSVLGVALNLVLPAVMFLAAGPG